MSLSSLYLDAFYACAQTGSFTKAAERLHVTQSALSQRILNLERDLETTLFVRDRGGIRLTEAGEELLAYCRAKEAIEAEALGRIGATGGSANGDRGLSGTIRIGGFSSVMRSVILPALSSLLAENPKLRLALLTREMSELPSLLRRGEIDFMVTDEEIKSDSIASFALGEEKNVLIEKKGYKGPEIFLDHDEDDQTTLKYLRHQRRTGKIERRYLDDVYGIIEGARLGLGRAVVPLHLIKGDADFKILEASKPLRVPVVLHHLAQPYYTRLHQEVVSSLTRVCPQLLK